MSDQTPILVSFPLCPYVQRAAIVLAEKGVAFRRIDIDLADKPDWFLRLSPTGRVPLLRVGDAVLFESAAIIEYLDEVHAPRLHPDDPLTRARHRAWIDQGSALLSDLWTIETTKDQARFDAACASLQTRLSSLAQELGDRNWFGGARFSLVDAVHAPVFRYFDLLEDAGLHLVPPALAAWRGRLMQRASVIGAVPPDYAPRLRAFVMAEGGILSTRLSL